VIPSAQGGTHVCKGFKVEERAPNEFVVFCEAPFILKTGSQFADGGQSTANKPPLEPSGSRRPVEPEKPVERPPIKKLANERTRF